MSSPRKHLQWTRIKEFGGLWTAGGQTLMPPDKAQVMSGCHPQPGGGLRAFYKVTRTLPNTGLTALASDEYAAGFAVDQLTDVTTEDTDVRLHLVITAQTGGAFDDWQLWRYEADNGDTSWSADDVTGLDLSVPGVTRVTQPQFAGVFVVSDTPFYDGDRYLVVGLGTAGMFTIALDGTVAAVDNGDYKAGSMLIEHQGRILSGHGDMVLFSAPGTLEFNHTDDPANPAAGFVRPNPAGSIEPGLDKTFDGTLIAWMLSVPPGDLLVATRDGRVYNLQGDVADPDVRELARIGATAPQEPVNAPTGIFFLVSNVGLVRFSLDGTIESVSRGLNETVWSLQSPATGLGQLAALDRYIFAPNMHTGEDHKNGVLVYDTAADAWFTSTHADEYAITNPRMLALSPSHHAAGLWVLSGAAPGALTDGAAYAFNIGVGHSATATEQRNAKWGWKSAPLRAPEGRRLTVRELEIPCYAWNASSTLEVTVGGTTRTVNLPAGRSHQSVLYRETGEVLDVTILAESNDADDEAPMVEELHIGWRDGQMVQ